MADNLTFPIGFDLQKAVEEAIQNWDKKYAKRLEQAIAKRPVRIKLEFEKLEDVKTRLAQLKIQPITPETRTAIRELAKELQVLAKALEQVQKFSKTTQLGQRNFTNDVQMEKLRQANERLEIQKRRVALAEQKHAEAMQRSATASRQLSSEFQNQDGYISRLIKRMAVYASFSYMSQFLTNVREVTAQFELQRISLGAIIQDQNRANQLFSEIKSFALQSTVSILDLTKYTKQLAAYKFETEELFDWTKRLTDISVGLSVPMERIVLLAGQVRATGFLRGCLGKGTIVVMLDGSKKKVEDIEVGDVVMGDDERGRNVLSLIHNREMMYVVKYDSGTFRCNENHILTVFNQETNQVEDVYILEYLRSAHKYKGIRRINSHYEYFDMTIERDCVDDYYGFEIDDNKRFIIEDNIVTHNSEVRQATEAGIPLVEELAAKLTKMNGEMVTAAEVMDMISKRAISWEMVADIFKDMTSAGGTFYNMQEKQGNTLFGLWAKLGDAASVMYDQIGNTESVNQGMKTAIGLLTELMRNWKAVANTAQYFILPNAAILALYKYSTASQRVEAAQSAAAAATERRKAAVLQLAKLNEKATVDEINAAWATLQKAKADEVAAQKATTRMGLLKSGFVSVAKSIGAGLGIGLAITAVTTLVYKLFEAYENAHRLKNKLKEIDAERIIVTEQSVRNFEYLADAAIKAADGSKEQKDKLDELHRTFKDMIPIEDMSIENLRKLRSGADSASEGYRSLTESIRNYIAQQQKQKALGAIEEEFGVKRITAMKNLYDWFDKQGLGVEERTRFFAEFEKQAQDTSKSLKEQIVAAFNEAGIEGGEELAYSIAEEKGFWNKALECFGKNQPLMFGPPAIAYKAVFPNDGYINDLANATRKYNEEVSGTLSYYEGLEGTLGKYTKAMEDAKKHMADFIPQGFKSDTFAYQQEVNAEQIRTWGGVIVDALKAENIKIENEWFNIDNDKAFSIADIATINIQAIKDALGSGHGDIKKLLDNIAKGYNEIVPKDAVVRSVRSKFEELADSMGLIDKVRGNMMGATEGLEAYRKKINDTAKDYAKQVENLTKVLAATPVISLAYKEIADKLENAKDLEEFYSKMAEILGKSTSGGGTHTSDPRLQILNDIANKMAQINKEYDDLLKKEGQTKALADTQKLFASSFADMQKVADKYKFKLPAFEVPQTIEDVQKWYKAIMDNINRLGIKNADKVLIELGFKRDKSAIDKQQREIESELKRLADRISRTKTAKGFYEKIISTTGDYSLASKVAESIFGQNGSELRKALAEQVRSMAGDIPLPDNIISADNVIEYKALRQFAEANKNELGKMYDELIKISNDGQKDLAKTYEGYLKDLEKAKTYADKRVELARTTAEKIRNINADIAAGNIDEKVGKATIRGLQDREDKEAAKLEYEAFKDTPIYIQMFEDLEHASTTTLEMMKSRLESLSHVWGTALDPTQLKEVQSRMNEIDEQLRNRNPFKTLKSAYLDYKNAVESVSLQGAVANAGAASKEFYERSEMYGADSTQARAAEKELKAREKIVGIARQLTDEQGKQLKGQQALDKAQKIALDNQLNANAALSIAAAEEQAMRDASKYENPDEDPKVIAAHEAVEKAKEEVNLAQRVSEIVQKNAKTSKTLKENLIGAANQVTQFMQIGADVAQAIGDTMEALGANEDDVQYFNDIATALGDITAGFQGIIDSALSLNVGGIISNAIGVIPNMVKGFVGLFTAGKVKRANKEIKRQQQLLDQLEYTYGRLEKAADKAFGADFVANQKQQRKILLAQAEAYQKQYQAELSKGKKADEKKLKEFQEKYRDTMDAIADMEGQVAERMLGTDLTSAARDFANAWLEAYKEFGNTADAMSEKFHEMIQNMIVESLLAKVMERALKPAFDMIDNMNEEDFYSESFWKKVMATAEQGAKDADHGAGVVMKWIEQMGYDMREMGSEYTGIAKEVSSASSEEINQLSAFVNTALYYVSPIPTISDNVAVIRQLMERGTTSTLPDTTAAGWTDWQQQAMDNYNAIARNTADTVVECRRAANACEAATEKLNRALRAKGATIGFNVFLNS